MPRRRPEPLTMRQGRAGHLRRPPGGNTAILGALRWLIGRQSHRRHRAHGSGPTFWPCTTVACNHLGRTTEVDPGLREAQRADRTSGISPSDSLGHSHPWVISSRDDITGLSLQTRERQVVRFGQRLVSDQGERGMGMPRGSSPIHPDTTPADRAPQDSSWRRTLLHRWPA